MTRRTLLQAFLLTVLGAVALMLLGGPARLWQAMLRLSKPRLDASALPGSLSDVELENLAAFGEVLVEGRTLSTTDRGHLIEYLDDRTRSTPGYLPLYRMTASLLDRLAGARFGSLDIRGRAEIMVRYRLTSDDVSPREYLLPFRRQELAVRVLAVPDLIGGYYRSAPGWALVGYDAFPGRPSNLIRYTLPGP